MGVYDSIRAGNGVIGWLNNNENIVELPKPKNKSYKQMYFVLNEMVMAYGKAFGIKMAKHNSPRYKGTFVPFNYNCQEIQENFPQWVKWVKETYPKS